MAKEVTIQLIEPFVGHKGMVTAITLREPRASEVFRLGELQVVSRGADGSTIYLDRDEVYGRYLDLLLVGAVEAGIAEVSSQISLADSYQVRDVINGFFSKAQVLAYERMRGSSSGKSDGSQPPSS